VLLARRSVSLHWLDSGERNYKFHHNLFLGAYEQQLEGLDIVEVRPIVIDLAGLTWLNRSLSFTGVGSSVSHSAHRNASGVVIVFIRKIQVPTRHLQFHIFQPLATQCLHCPPDEILSTPK